MTCIEQRNADRAKAFVDIEYQLYDVVGMARLVSRLHEGFEAEMIAAKEAHGYSGPNWSSTLRIG